VCGCSYSRLSTEHCGPDTAVCLLCACVNEVTFDLDIWHGGLDHLEPVWIRFLGQAHG